MWDFLTKVAEEAGEYELTTWAGIINIVGFLVVMQTIPSVTITEVIANRVVTWWEGSRRYRAAKRGFEYDPVFRDTRPKPDRGARLKTLLAIIVYLVLSVAVIAAVDQLA